MKDTKIDDIAMAVKRGADLLDSRGHGPEWREAVLKPGLDMSSPTECIFGRLFGTFREGPKKLGFDPNPAKCVNSLIQHGFKLCRRDRHLHQFLALAWTVRAKQPQLD